MELSFAKAGTESLPPDDEKSAAIFSRIGYRFADAVADLVDNSIDAAAKNVHVRFVRTNAGISSVQIVDDGRGMDEETLREAMRFGSRGKKSEKQLGKYGIGLKTASLSQAESVTVLSKQDASAIGRRWTIENIGNNWSCDLLAAADVVKPFMNDYGETKIAKSGTIIIWQRLEHLRALPDHTDQVLTRTIKELRTELGIRFHRFLESRKVRISIDQQIWPDDPTGVVEWVEPLDPFSYEAAGEKDYPKTEILSVEGTPVECTFHIWPPRSNNPGYRLGGGKVALRQGFYFYRNDRVIQAGGWNGLRGDDGEPHLSLARVAVELPPKLDSLFKLDVAKSRLDPSPSFLAALQKENDSGFGLASFLDTADRVYRRQKSKDGARFTVVPGAGIPKPAQAAIASLLKEKGIVPKRVSFAWKRLDLDELFRIDKDQYQINLNTRFRKELCEGDNGDAPVLKVALMFLLQAELEKSITTRKSVSWVQRLNHSLIAALKS